MPETANIEPKGKPARAAAADKKAFAQVERWMAIIREISREEAKTN